MNRTVQLRAVARLSDHTHFEISRREVNVRKGPYPYYGELFERFEVDDYGVDAPAVLFVSAMGQVLNAEGGFRVALERGRCGSGGFAHVVVPHDPADAAYLRACLETLPDAVDYIAGANNLQTLDELAVLRIALPWPCRETRDAYATAVEAAEGRVRQAHDALVAARERLAQAEKAGESDAACAPLREGCRAADAARDAARDARAVLVNDFMTFGVLGDCDCTPVEPVAVTGLPSYSDARAERARVELRARAEQQAAERGGVAVAPALHAALGPLAPVVDGCAFGLGTADLAWELAPLAVVRACSGADVWDALVRQAAADPEGVPASIDAALAGLAAEDPCFSLLPNLSYASSMLDGGQLAAWVDVLAGVDPAQVTPAVLRAAFDLAGGAAAVPPEVTGLVSDLLHGWAQPGQSVYLPFVDHSGLGDAASVGAPACSLHAQCCDNAALLELLAVRGVATCRDAGGQGASADRSCAACAPGASALLDDRHAGLQAHLVVLDAKNEGAPWSPTPPRRDDPRWVLGTPNRMRSAYARLQQGLAHLAPGGRLVALVPTFELQTAASGDAANRGALVAQGRVQAVVALPPRIWGDGRPPTSLLVAGGEGSAPRCLMVDATALDQTCDEAVFGPDPQRSLAPGVRARLAALLGAWCAGGDEGERAVLEEPDLARVVDREELEADGCLLVPWRYVHGAPAPVRA